MLRGDAGYTLVLIDEGKLMDDSKRYFLRSWRMLTCRRGWVKPILVLSVAWLVPIAGPLALLGYALEWARLSAWGVDSSPKQSKVQVGGCIVSGWRAFVVALCWSLVWGCLVGLLGSALMAGFGSDAAGILNAAVFVSSLFVGMIMEVAMVRAAVYQKCSAGLNPVRVWELVARDPKGLFKLIGIDLVCDCIVWALLAAGFFALVALREDQFTGLVQFAEIQASGLQMMGGIVPVGMSVQIVQVVIEILQVAIPLAVVFGFPISVVTVAALLLRANAVGLWMAKFNVPEWGGPSDPLPCAAQLPPDAGATR